MDTYDYRPDTGPKPLASEELSVASILVSMTGKTDLSKAFDEASRAFLSAELAGTAEPDGSNTGKAQVGYYLRSALGGAVRSHIEGETDPQYSGAQRFARLRATMAESLDAGHPGFEAVDKLERALDQVAVERRIDRQISKHELQSEDLSSAHRGIVALGDAGLRKDFEALAGILLRPEFIQPDEGRMTSSQREGYYMRQQLGLAVRRTLGNDPDGELNMARLRQTLKSELEPGHPAFQALDTFEKSLGRFREERAAAASMPREQASPQQQSPVETGAPARAAAQEPAAVTPARTGHEPISSYNSEALKHAGFQVGRTANPELQASFRDAAAALLGNEFIQSETGPNTPSQCLGFGFRDTLGHAVTRSLTETDGSGRETFQRLRAGMKEWLDADHPAIGKVDTLEKFVESHVRQRDSIMHRVEREEGSPDRVDRLFHIRQNGLDSPALNSVLDRVLKIKDPELVMATYNAVEAAGTLVKGMSTPEARALASRKVGETMQGLASGDPKAISRFEDMVQSLGKPGAQESLSSMQNFGRRASEFLREFSAGAKSLLSPVIDHDRRREAIEAHTRRFQEAAAKRMGQDKVREEVR